MFTTKDDNKRLLEIQYTNVENEPSERESHVKQGRFLFAKNVGRTQCLDLTSCLASVVALCIAFNFLGSGAPDRFNFNVTDANSILAQQGTQLYNISLGDLIGNAVNQQCPIRRSVDHPILSFFEFWFFGYFFQLRNKYALKPSTLTARYDKILYKGTTVTNHAGSYNPLYLLIWIFIVSIVFQGARVYLYVAKGNRGTNNAQGGKQYRPYAGPDFWRWVEYALTAPLQIVIIASSFMMDDKAVLLLLGGLQGGLMLLGYNIEMLIRKVHKHMRKPLARKRNYKGKLIYLLLSAWGLHSIVWFVLFERFFRQKDNINACGLTEDMPPAVTLIVYGEFVLFSLFGLVQTVQTLVVLFAHPHPAIVEPSDCTSCQNTHPKKDSKSWEVVSSCYAVLSVTAKSLLEYGFLVLVTQVPNTVGKV